MFSLHVTFAADRTSHIKNQPLFKQQQQQKQTKQNKTKTNKQNVCVMNRVLDF